MKENNYDNPGFFSQYRRFPRSVEGLSAAGEWHALQKLFPDFSGKRVLDLGCGFGWHCRYAADHGGAGGHLRRPHPLCAGGHGGGGLPARLL